MFRYDHPDALLVLLMVAAAYAMVRALEAAGTRWLVLAGTALGFAFLTKMLQGFLVLPGFALGYLVCAPTSVRRRIGQLLIAGAAVVVSAGWWVLAVALWPASARPYIGGSTDNTVLDLVFGYNGFGRLFGQGGGARGGGSSAAPAGSSFGGTTGLERLFGSEMGNEISWLLPAALIALVAGLWITRNSARTDRTRAGLLLWGGWLVVTGLVFSYMSGIVHPYYTVALAPAIAGLVAVGGRALWLRRDMLTARVGLAAMAASSAGWGVVLLHRVPTWHPELRYLITALGIAATAGLLVPPRRLGRLAAGVATAGIVGGLLGSSSFALATAATTHTGSIPSVGPAVAATAAGGLGSGPQGNGGPPPGTRPPGTRPPGARPPAGAPTGLPGGTAPSGGTPASGLARGGGSTGSTLAAALRATTTTWAAATVGDMSAAELELASGKAVMAIGGWSGSDNSPTLAQFQKYVAEGKIGYFIAAGAQGGGRGGGRGGGGQGGVAGQITQWVTAHYQASTVGGQTVYDLQTAAP